MGVLGFFFVGFWVFSSVQYIYFYCVWEIHGMYHEWEVEISGYYYFNHV